MHYHDSTQQGTNLLIRFHPSNVLISLQKFQVLTSNRCLATSESKAWLCSVFDTHSLLQTLAPMSHHW